MESDNQDTQQEDNQENTKRKGALGEVVKAETMIQLAIALPAGCLIGWFAGDWLDHHFHQGWIGIAGIVLGAAAGFIQILTTAQRFLKKGS